LIAPVITSRPLSCDRVGVYMTDPTLFDEVVSLGEDLIWLHTFAERFRLPTRTDRIPTVDGLRWQHPVSYAYGTHRRRVFQGHS
jgi:hypothetical protein